MSTGHMDLDITGNVVLDIKNLEHVPTPTPADQSPGHVALDITGHVVLDIKNLEHVPTTSDDESEDKETPEDETEDEETSILHFYEERQNSLDQSLISRLQKEIEKSIEEFDSSEQITKIQPIPGIMAESKFGKDCYRARVMVIGPIGLHAEEDGSLKHKLVEDYPEKQGIRGIMDCYRPRDTDIGPFVRSAGDRLLKRKLAVNYIRNSGRTSDDLLVSIKNEIETLSTCFHSQVLEYYECHSDDTDSYNEWLRYLARMLLLDGCSILQFIYSRANDKLKELQINNGQAPVIEQDLFMMENQIPFRVLEILMDQLPSDGAFSRTVLQQSIDKFIEMNLMMPENVLKRSYLDFYKEKHPVHLLDILRSGLLYGFDANNIDRLRNSKSSDSGSKNYLKKEYFRNIQELKSAGIKLESSGTSCLGDVTFTSFGWFRAWLKIPQLFVNDATERKLWNLVAYEMCPDNCNSDFGVTSYVCLLDSLIDSEEDVKELRSAGILKSRLGSDKEVAKLFNEIGYNTVSDTDQAYRQVKQKIQMHFDKLWPTVQFLIVQFKQEYFRSPWTFIALLGSIVVLALTATQTYFTINPTK